jgi:hypothetical protein
MYHLPLSEHWSFFTVSSITCVLKSNWWTHFFACASTGVGLLQSFKEGLEETSFDPTILDVFALSKDPDAEDRQY